MKKIGIISDTHGCWDNRYGLHFADCDEIWHAGDVGDYMVIERLEEICKVRAVKGNADWGECARKLPERIVFTVEGINVFLTHIGGYPGKWHSAALRQTLADEKIGLMVDGHSHILRIMSDKSLNLLHINPGAAGKQGWQKKRTLVKLTLDNGDMRDCEVIELA